MQSAIDYLDYSDKLSSYKKYKKGKYYFLIFDEYFNCIDNVNDPLEAYYIVKTNKKLDNYLTCEVWEHWHAI